MVFIMNRKIVSFIPADRLLHYLINATYLIHEMKRILATTEI